MLSEVKFRKAGRKIISFMDISLEGFVARPNGEMNWIKVDEEIFDHVGKQVSEGDTALYERATYFHPKTLRSKDAKISLRLKFFSLRLCVRNRK